MKKAKIVRVAEWDGWCSSCAAERPLVLTRTGRLGLRSWLTGVVDPDQTLILTCRLCGVCGPVPYEQDDPPVLLEEPETPNDLLHPALDAEPTVVPPAHAPTRAPAHAPVLAAVAVPALPSVPADASARASSGAAAPAPAALTAVPDPAHSLPTAPEAASAPAPALAPAPAVPVTSAFPPAAAPSFAPALAAAPAPAFTPVSAASSAQRLAPTLLPAAAPAAVPVPVLSAATPDPGIGLQQARGSVGAALGALLAHRTAEALSAPTAEAPIPPAAVALPASTTQALPAPNAPATVASAVHLADQDPDLDAFQPLDTPAVAAPLFLPTQRTPMDVSDGIAALQLLAEGLDLLSTRRD